MNQIYTRFPFLPLTLALVVGILLQHFFKIQLPYLVIGYFLVLILISIFSFHKLADNRISILLISLFCLFGFIRFSSWKSNRLDQEYLNHLPLHDVTITGKVKSVQETYRLKATLELSKIERDSLTARVHGMILLYFPYQYNVPIIPGQVLSISKTQLEDLPAPRNPGQFDYGTYLRWRGIIAECNIENENQITVLKIEPSFSLENSIFAPFRSVLMEKLETYFSPSSAGFLKALLLGRRESLDKDVMEDFQNAGVIHVLAISGLHVGFVALIFYITLSFFPLYFRHRNLLIVLLLLFYMFLTGAQPPVIRATLMTALVLISINIERPVSIYNSIFAVGFIILLFQPQQLFWVGFQFSFVAVLSIIYFYQKLGWVREKLLQFIKNNRIKSLVDKGVLIPLLVSFSAQIGTLPLTMHYFHKLSLIAFFLNILVIPFIGFIVALGFLFFLISFLSSAFAHIFADFLGVLLNLLFNSIETATEIPAAFFYIPRFSILSILLYLSVIMLLFNFKKEWIRKLSFTATVFLTLILTTKSISESRQLNLVIMDVGQGDAAFILTPQKKSILIDTGPANQFSSSARNAILPVLNYFDVDHLNKLFISHPHLDHMGGTFGLLKYISIDSVYLSPMNQPYKWKDSLLNALSKNSIPHRELKMGDRMVIDNDTRAYVLGPFPRFSNFTEATGRNLNNNSLVLLIKHRDHTLLFPGDAEREVEKQLILWKDLLKTDFLKVGHHGSKTSSSEKFLRFVQPLYCSISAGENNKFGHPSANVIERLQKFGSNIFRTDEDRAIMFQVYDGRWKRVHWN